MPDYNIENIGAVKIYSLNAQGSLETLPTQMEVYVLTHTMSLALYDRPAYKALYPEQYNVTLPKAIILDRDTLQEVPKGDVFISINDVLHNFQIHKSHKNTERITQLCWVTDYEPNYGGDMMVSIDGKLEYFHGPAKPEDKIYLRLEAQGKNKSIYSMIREAEWTGRYKQTMSVEKYEDKCLRMGLLNLNVVVKCPWNSKKNHFHEVPIMFFK